MRKIKFKAFDVVANKWVHKIPCDIMGEVICLGGWMNSISLERFNDIRVVQYTGLNDKNGKEIYEGDFVKSDIHNPPIYKVEFIEGGFCCTHKDAYPIDINHFYPSHGMFIEVVGNIFDNPEMKGE